MKEELVKLYGLRFVSETKWNIIYDGVKCTLIWNKVSKDIKIKPKY